MIQLCSDCCALNCVLCSEFLDMFKEFLDIQAAIECEITLKHVRDMKEHTVKCTVQISTNNTAQLFGQFG